MRFRKQFSAAILEGDLTPMIDMTFQLIAFFMVLINFSQTEQDAPIMLPNSVLAKPPDHAMEYPITVHLTEKGTIFYGGQELKTLNRLRPYLANERAVLEGRGSELSEATIIIRGDQHAKTGVIQELIKVCQEEGFEEYSLRAKEVILP